MASSGPAKRIRIVTGSDDFGCPLKDSILSHLQSLPDVQLVDLGSSPYYSIAQDVARLVSSPPDSTPTRGILVCGTGAGVNIFANRFPRVYAATCLSVADALNARSINSSNVLCLSVADALNARSINSSNVLCLSGLSTPPADASRIVEAWLDAPFNSPCPASGNAPWSPDLSDFLDKSLPEIAKITGDASSPCAICCLRKGMDFEEVKIMPGGEMRIVRESPTAAYVKFARGSIEPAHHHTFGHDVVVRKGRKKVWNLSKGESYELKEGDYLYTPAGDLHRVKYLEDTEFFIRWDGGWDIFLDEDLEAATAAIAEELR